MNSPILTGAATAFLISCQALAASLAPASHNASSGRPNVIYAFSDEHRWQSMSFTEMPGVKTPNMDRLARQGCSFTHCISNYPVCTPHRAILLTGRWPYQQGLIDNDIALNSGEMTIGKAFKAAGYATGYIGKWHLGGRRAEPFGFDLSLIWEGTNQHWKSTWFPASGPAVQEKAYNASVMTRQAIQFIEAHRGEPFFLMLSWNPPHTSFTDPPPEFQALYPDQGLLPFRPNVPAVADRRRGGGVSEVPTWEVYRGYHAHISAIDAELGRLMQKLDELGLADNTVLVYSSDHGSMQGSHGVGGKRQPYEESIRVPFIVRWPGVIPEGIHPDELFGTIDVMPSLCSLAGIPVPPTCEGINLSPIMRGQPGPTPASQFMMHVSKGNASGGDGHPAPLFRGVTTGRYTYAVQPDGPWCLFDNAQDPYQAHNLIDDPGLAGVRGELRGMLAEWLKKAKDPFVLPAEGPAHK